GSSKPPSLNLENPPRPPAPAPHVMTRIRTRLVQRRRWMRRPSHESMILPFRRGRRETASFPAGRCPFPNRPPDGRPPARDGVLVRDGAFARPGPVRPAAPTCRSEEHTSELQSRENLVCRLLLEKKK